MTTQTDNSETCMCGVLHSTHAASPTRNERFSKTGENAVSENLLSTFSAPFSSAAVQMNHRYGNIHKVKNSTVRHLGDGITVCPMLNVIMPIPTASPSQMPKRVKNLLRKSPIVCGCWA